MKPRIRPARDPKQQGTEDKGPYCAPLAGCEYKESWRKQHEGFTHFAIFCELLPTIRSASKYSLRVVSLGYQCASTSLKHLSFSHGYNPSCIKPSGSSAWQSAPGSLGLRSCSPLCLLYIYIILFIFDCPGSSLLHRLFSSCSVWGLFYNCIAQASHGGGFSCHRAHSPGCPDFDSSGSQALEHRLRSCGSWTSLLQGTWDLPRSGIELMSPALAGGFFSMELAA